MLMRFSKISGIFEYLRHFRKPQAFSKTSGIFENLRHFRKPQAFSKISWDSRNSFDNLVRLIYLSNLSINQSIYLSNDYLCILKDAHEIFENLRHFRISQAFSKTSGSLENLRHFRKSQAFSKTSGIFENLVGFSKQFRQSRETDLSIQSIYLSINQSI